MKTIKTSSSVLLLALAALGASCTTTSPPPDDHSACNGGKCDDSSAEAQDLRCGFGNPCAMGYLCVGHASIPEDPHSGMCKLQCGADTGVTCGEDQTCVQDPGFPDLPGHCDVKLDCGQGTACAPGYACLGESASDGELSSVVDGSCREQCGADTGVSCETGQLCVSWPGFPDLPGHCEPPTCIPAGQPIGSSHFDCCSLSAVAGVCQ